MDIELHRICRSPTFSRECPDHKIKLYPEIKQRAVRLFFESAKDYPFILVKITAIMPKIGRTPETLHVWY